MSGLILNLAPHERILINGAVVENGDRRSRLAIKSPQANVLRLKDAIHPDQADTPVKRLCYDAQLILSGDLEPEEGKQRLIAGIERLSRILDDKDSTRTLDDAGAAALSGNSYLCLRLLRQLIPREQRLLEISVS